MISIIIFFILILILYSIDTIEHYAFCIVDHKRICSENNRCLATDEDIDNAINYAYKRVCEDRGYTYIQFADGFDCVHTRETCLRDTRYPSTDTNKYLEWNMDNKCVIGMEAFRNYCHTSNNGKLRYDDRRGTCHVTPQSCSDWGADWTGDDCHVPWDQKVTEAVVGQTATRWMKAQGLDLTAMASMGMSETVKIGEMLVDPDTYKDPLGTIGETSLMAADFAMSNPALFSASIPANIASGKMDFKC